MSVPQGKRTESKLAVQTKTIELADYTTSICSNEKNFPKRHRWTVTSKIVDVSLEIMGDVNEANSIYVSSKVDYEENVKKRKRKLRKFKKLTDEGKMTKEKVDECYESWKTHAEKGNSYNLIKRMDEYYENLWKE